METLLLVVRLILVGIFALAGIGKLLDLEGSKKAVRDFGVPEILAKPFAVLLPIAELVVAALLLFVQTSWFGAIGATGLLLIFIGGMIVQMIKGNAPDCHCFGQIHSEPVSARSLIRNAVFAILSLFLVVSGKENQGLSLFSPTSDFSEGGVMQIIIGLAMVALLAAVVYFLKKISEQQTQIMRRIEILELTASEGVRAIERQDVEHPESGLPIGAPAPAFALPDLSGKNVSFENLLVKNKPTLFFYVSPTCGPCAALLPDIEKWQDEMKDKLSFVFISSGKVKDNAEKFGGKNFKQVLLQKDKEVAELFGAQWTPTAWLVNSDGTIASRPAAGDAAIRKMIDSIKAEISDKDTLYIANGNGHKSPLLGKEFPEFSLEDATGNQVNTDDLKGKKTLVAFWSLGCGFCSKMLDDLREWNHTKGQDEPDLFLLSSGDKEENLELDLRGTIVLDNDRNISKQIGMDGTPSAVLVNEEGKVVSEVAVGAEQIWKLIGKRK